MGDLINTLPGSTFANVLCVCSWCGQMFEWRRGRRLRVFLLPGKLDLRHGRNAWNLRTLPAHSCYLQHRGECFVLTIDPNAPRLSSRFSIALWCPSAGKDLCEEKPAVHLAGNLIQGFPDDPPLQHLPEDDRGGQYQRNPQQIAPVMFSC